MRIASAVFAAVFLLASVVQWNDPDPILWIAGYLLAATLSLAAAFDRVPFGPNALAAIGFTIWFVSLASSLSDAPREAFTSFEMQTHSHEEPREAIGLALCAGWCAALAVWGRRREAAASGGDADVGGAGEAGGVGATGGARGTD